MMKVIITKDRLQGAVAKAYGSMSPDERRSRSYAIRVKAEIEQGAGCVKLVSLTERRQFEVAVPAIVESEGQMDVRASLLAKIVKCIPEHVVNIESVEGVFLHMRGECFDYEFRAFCDAEVVYEIDKMITEEKKVMFRLQVPVLHEMLRKVLYAASEDSSRRTLSSVCVEYGDGMLRFVATDGKRLSFVEVETETEGVSCDFLIDDMTARKLFEMSRKSSFGVYARFIVRDKSVVFEWPSERIRVVFLKIDEAFPQYRNVIPNESNRLAVVDRLLMLEAVNAAMSVSYGFLDSVWIVFEEGKCKVRLSNEDVNFQRSFNAKINGEPFEASFNAKYLKQYLLATDDDEIVVKAKANESGVCACPFVFTSTIPAMYVVMPNREI